METNRTPAVTLGELKEIFDDVFGEGLDYTFSIFILLLELLPEQITDEGLEQAGLARNMLYNRIKKLKDEAIRFEELCSSNIGRGIRT